MKWLIISPALAILLIAPVWAGLGLLKVEEGGGHEHGMASSNEVVQEFVDEVNAFVEANKREDGWIAPHHDEENGAHEEEHEAEHEHAEEHTVVYLQARQFDYVPARLVLEAGETYEFRMMATDVTHGASILLGEGSKMIRLPAGVPLEQEITFTEPGEYLIYCSFYCGAAHPFMSARILVEEHEGDEMHSGEEMGGEQH